MRVSVIIPCYNEESAISAVIASIPKDVGEIIVVDNNSTDTSAEVARKQGARVVTETRQGYGAAIRRGCKEAQGDILVVLDADGQYPAEAIPAAISYLQNNNVDFVSCARFPLNNKKSLPFVRRVGNEFFTVITNLLFGTELRDSQSGMWVFKKKILDVLSLNSFDMPLSQEIKLRAIKHPHIKFGEFHVDYRERTGESKLVPLKHGLKNLIFLLKLRVELWRTQKEEKKRFLFGLAVIGILALFMLAAFQHIRDPFIHVTADVNGQNGLAAENLAHYGFFEMKFGLYGRLLDDPAQTFGKFYTHHPTFFLVPTAILYKLFGVSELTTRLGPLLTLASALLIFAFALRKLSNQYLFPLLAVGIFCMLPGAIFYCQTFELAVFSIPASLVTFSFFIFYYKTELSLYKWLFYVSIGVGGLLGWFYYFFVGALWMYLLFFKEMKMFKDRKQPLIILPILMIALFGLNLLHFYILNGKEGLNLKAAFFTRASRVPLDEWLKWVWFLLRIHINEVFMALAALGMALAVLRRKQDAYMHKALLFAGMALGVALVFFQWTMHPFGAIFVWSVVSLYAAYALTCLILKYKKLGAVIAIAVLIAGAHLTTKKMDFFYNKYRILHEDDIVLLNTLKGMVEDDDICLGRDARGIGVAGIAEWYLDKTVVESPHCFDTKASIALVFNTQLGQSYADEQELFKQNGFYFAGCKHYWCVMAKPGNPLIKK